MKILLLCKRSSRTGGVQKVLRELANGLAALGQDAVFGALRTSGADGILPESDDDDRSSAVPSAALPGGLINFARFVRTWKPDVILSAHEQANFANVAARHLLRSRHKIVLTRHIAFETGDLREGGALRRQVLRPLYRSADAAVGVSHGITSELRELAGEGLRTQTIYNPVATSDFAGRLSEEPAVDLPTGAPIFISAGRLVPQKDFETLIRAFAIVRRSVPAHLVILGDGPQRSQLEDLSRQLEVAGSVLFTGYVSNPLPLFARSQCFVCSSRWEGLPVGLTEALLSGTAVASTDCPYGPREILEDGRLGFLAEVGNPASLADAMVAALAAGPPDISGVAERFSSRKSAENYLQLFDELVAG